MVFLQSECFKLKEIEKTAEAERSSSGPLLPFSPKVAHERIP
jgi:hypothetical protein